MKKALIVLVAAILSVAHADDLIIPAPAGNIITMTGSAIRLVPNASQARPIMCASILLQELAGSTAVVYVLNAAPNFTMAMGSAGTTTVGQLGAGTATAPGNSWTWPSNNPSATQSGGVDMRYIGVVGTASDTVLAVCTLKQ